MTTGRDVIYDALRRAGITGRGITPSATDTQDALADLNDMIGQWRTMGVMVWDKLNVGFPADSRITPYSVGPGGDYNVSPRPNRIYAAFIRQTSSGVGNLPVDTPLRVIDAREEYDRISTKTLRSFSQAVFLDTAMPLAQLYVYPWPNSASYSVYITLRGSIPVVTLVLDLAGFPEPYIPAMKFNLARRLRQSYGRGMKPDPELIKFANDSLDVIQQMNIQLPEMMMPAALLQRGAGYNIFSDQFGS